MIVYAFITNENNTTYRHHNVVSFHAKQIILLIQYSLCTQEPRGWIQIESISQCKKYAITWNKNDPIPVMVVEGSAYTKIVDRCQQMDSTTADDNSSFTSIQHTSHPCTHGAVSRGSVHFMPVIVLFINQRTILSGS